MRHELARRRPGQSKLSTQRKEEDEPGILSGVLRGAATGAPVTIFIRNTDVDSRPYDSTRDLPRPGHADFTAWAKWGAARDHRGGGPFSARVTAPLVAAGSIARQLLHGVRIAGHVVAAGGIEVPRELTFEQILKADAHPTRCADPKTADLIEHAILRARSEADSIGGVVSAAPRRTCEVGRAGKRRSRASWPALFAIGRQGREFGAGFAPPALAAPHNDRSKSTRPEKSRRARITPAASSAESHRHAVVRVALTVASLPRPRTPSTSRRRSPRCWSEGRHDPCVVPRAVPIVKPPRRAFWRPETARGGESGRKR